MMLRENVAWVDSTVERGLCLVARVPDGEVIELRDASYLFFTAWAEGQDFEASVEELAKLSGQPVETVRAAGRELAETLHAQGITDLPA